MRKNFLIYFFLLLVLVAVSLLLVNDIYNPIYSFIGDEYAFFDKAKEITENKFFNYSIFSQRGVFDYHPMLDSIYQAIVMKIFGANLFGWKISNIIITVFAIALVFKIAQLIFSDNLIGLAAAIFFGFSRHLFSFAHIGYNSLHSLIPFLLAALFYFRYDKQKRDGDIFIAGLFSGLSFYTFYSARLILLLIPVFLLKNKRGFICYILGLLITFLPFILFNKNDVILQVTHQTINHPEFKYWNINGLLSFLPSFFIRENIISHHYFIGPFVGFIPKYFNSNVGPKKF